MVARERGRCKHCRAVRSLSCRGLCHGCFGLHRDLYPKLGRRRAGGMLPPCARCGVRRRNGPTASLCVRCRLEEVEASDPRALAMRAALEGGVGAAQARSPCRHPPGSGERMAVLSARAALGLPLFAPGDAGADLR